MGTLSLSHIQPQDELYESRNVTDFITQENPVIYMPRI